MPRPAVVDEIRLDRAPDHEGAEVLHPLPLPTGPQVLAELLVGGPVPSHPDRRRRALEHVHVLRRLRQRRHRLDPARAHTDDADDLVGELGQVRVVGPAAGVLVVPPGGVERRALEVVHARDRRQLHEVEDPGRQDEVAGAHLVAAIGADHPAGAALVPLARLDAGVEERIVHQAVLRRDRVEVPADLVPERVPRRRDVVHLLEHRHVDVGLDVAHHARVAVPVPGAPDAAGLVDQHDASEAGVAQLGPDDHTRHPGTDDGDVDLGGDGIALDERCVRIAGVGREPLVGLQVVEDPARLGHALGTLALVLVANRRGIELRDVLGGRCHGTGPTGRGA